MKKILVPVDFSSYSQYALEVAASIAKDHEAEIIVLHMLGISELKKDSDANYLIANAEEKFKLFLDKNYLKGIKITQLIKYYKVFRKINSVAILNKVDLIVMGSHGHDPMTELFVGSNTEKVVRTSQVPVLVIKEQISDFKIKEVVYGTDLRKEQIKTYRKAMKFFKKFDANVHLVYVVTPDERFRSSTQLDIKANRFFMEADKGNMENSKKFIYKNDYSIEEGIYNYSIKINADIISTSTHGRLGLSHFFLTSISEDLINHVNKPVITFMV